MPLTIEKNLIIQDGKPVATINKGTVLSVYGLDETTQAQIRALVGAPVRFEGFCGAEKRILSAEQEMARLRIMKRRNGY